MEKEVETKINPQEVPQEKETIQIEKKKNFVKPEQKEGKKSIAFTVVILVFSFMAIPYIAFMLYLSVEAKILNCYTVSGGSATCFLPFNSDSPDEILPLPSKCITGADIDKNIKGNWVYKDDTVEFNLDLNILDDSNKIVGSYCVSKKEEDSVLTDCWDVTENRISILGNVEKVTATLTLSDNINNQGGNAVAKYDPSTSTLNWELIKNPSSDTLIPLSAKLTKLEEEDLPTVTYTVTPEFMVGLWHQSNTLQDNWDKRLLLFKDGVYSLLSSQMQCDARKTQEEGTWKYENGVLYLTAIRESRFIGGDLVESHGRCTSAQNLVGATLTTKTLTEPIVKEYSIFSRSNKLENGLSNYDSIYVNNSEFYKVAEDPESYGTESFLKPSF